MILNLFAALAYAAGVALMKASDGLRAPIPAALVYVCFCAGATMQAFALRYQELGVSNTIVLGVEAMGAVTLGMVFFHEPMSLTKVTAIGLVAAGVFILRS